MNYLDLTLATPAANLACDEALLDICDENPEAETLRFWEPARHFVVLGYANRASSEANLAACRAEDIPVLRRCSGGGAVLQGPGCLNYSLVLNFARHSALHTIPDANRHIMEQQRRTVERVLGLPVSVQGVTDLSLDPLEFSDHSQIPNPNSKFSTPPRPLKFSGNAQRRKRHALLFHGTFLLAFDIALVQKILPMPSREPCYRQNRPHSQFLTNLPVPASALKIALRETWSALQPPVPPPQIPPLLAQKYAGDEWNLKF
jgi:lipoate-protein ligase A